MELNGGLLMNEWISIAEKLPEREGDYLTCFYSACEQSGFFKLPEKYSCSIQHFFIEEEKEFFNIDGYIRATKRTHNPRFLKPLTHWMQIPEKPT